MLKNATAADIAHVVANMRAVDRREIEALTGVSAEQAVASIDQAPYVALVIYEGGPIAVFGAMHLPGNVASMFRFATDAWPSVVREAIKFGRRTFLAKMWEIGVERIEAATLDEPGQTAWLKLFGADETEKFSRNGRNFVRFAITRPA